MLLCLDQAVHQLLSTKIRIIYIERVQGILRIPALKMTTNTEATKMIVIAMTVAMSS